MNDQQHGGMANAGNDFPQQSSQYNQYGQQNMRPGYPQNPNLQRGPSLGNRPPMGGSGMGMMPPNFNHGQPHGPQRFMSGPNIQQQVGPTPTLNSLLQNQNPGQRYPGYPSDYNMGPQKGGSEMGNSQAFNGPQGWGGPQQRPYQGQMQGNQPYRNQVNHHFYNHF